MYSDLLTWFYIEDNFQGLHVEYGVNRQHNKYT